MGVPAFFRWLSTKYEKIIKPAVEIHEQEIGGQKLPVDATAPNPNGIEYDNLYLDMNGIIHPCCHPEDRPPPETEDEMIALIFEHIDKIFNIVRPRKVLHMAIDGVAPRAKMNQQRSRRFRTAQENQEKEDAKIEMYEELERKGQRVDRPESSGASFDSNCITPGTSFMAHLADCLRYYALHRLNTNPAWRNIKVILSDAKVPGEGEHKIIDYIRKQRACTDYNPNTSHLLYGADADLIMLGLATHEALFHVMRDDLPPMHTKPCSICGQVGHPPKFCLGKLKQDENSKPFVPIPVQQKFVIIQINVLREYLEHELYVPNLSFGWDLERAIDDWVFLCFFVGNDFLPHLPSLEIREGAIDELVKVYKRNLNELGGYISRDGFVNCHRAQKLLKDIGVLEDDIFKKRKMGEEKRTNRTKGKKAEFKRRKKEVQEQERKHLESVLKPINDPTHWTKSKTSMQIQKQVKERKDLNDEKNKLENLDAAQKLKSFFAQDKVATVVVSKAVVEEEKKDLANDKKEEDELSDGSDTVESLLEFESKTETELEEKDTKNDKEGSKKRAATTREVDSDGFSDDDKLPQDDVRLWEGGWHQRYYRTKFDIDANSDIEFKTEIATAYMEGLCWVLLYYYQGCASWEWYYPYHYAPFASDIGEMKIPEEVTFKKNTYIFGPLEQLMGVMPASSGLKFLPPSWSALMTDYDSPIIDYYPIDFELDMNGKKFAWMGVVILPFIDASRLLDALKCYYKDLSESEKERNQLGHDFIFVGPKNPVFTQLCHIYESEDSQEWKPIKTQEKKQDFSGEISKDSKVSIPGSKYLSPLLSEGLKNIESNKAISVGYQFPQFDQDKVFESKILPGARFTTRVVTREDFEISKAGGSRNYSRNQAHEARKRQTQYRNGFQQAPQTFKTAQMNYSEGSSQFPYHQQHQHQQVPRPNQYQKHYQQSYMNNRGTGVGYFNEREAQSNVASHHNGHYNNRNVVHNNGFGNRHRPIAPPMPLDMRLSRPPHHQHQQRSQQQQYGQDTPRAGNNRPRAPPPIGFQNQQRGGFIPPNRNPRFRAPTHNNGHSRQHQYPHQPQQHNNHYHNSNHQNKQTRNNKYGGGYY